MGRNAKYSKEVKIKACKDYIAGKGSFRSIAKSVGCAESLLINWYNRYIEHGENTFNTSNRNESYSKKFKISIVKKYKINNCSKFILFFIFFSFYYYLLTSYYCNSIILHRGDINVVLYRFSFTRTCI